MESADIRKRIERYTEKSRKETERILEQKNLSREELTRKAMWALRWFGLGYMMNPSLADAEPLSQLYQNDINLLRGIVDYHYRTTKSEMKRLRKKGKKGDSVPPIEQRALMARGIILQAITHALGTLVDKTPTLAPPESKAINRHILSIGAKQSRLFELIHDLNEKQLRQILRAPRYKEMSRWALYPKIISEFIDD